MFSASAHAYACWQMSHWHRDEAGEDAGLHALHWDTETLPTLSLREDSASQERHVFVVFVFYQTAGARSGACMCEWERRRQRERMDGWIKAEQLPTPLECERVVTSLSISIISHECTNAGVVCLIFRVSVCIQYKHGVLSKINSMMLPSHSGVCMLTGAKSNDTNCQISGIRGQLRVRL